VYKTLSKDIYRQSLGAIDMSPNTLYFFTNSYLDGISKMFLELPYSLTDLAQGEKTFNPKTDVPLFGSFFGAKTNVDSREYGKIEKKILEIFLKYIKTFYFNGKIILQKKDKTTFYQT
jgi:hypothetical protein